MLQSLATMNSKYMSFVVLIGCSCYFVYYNHSASTSSRRKIEWRPETVQNKTHVVRHRNLPRHSFRSLISKPSLPPVKLLNVSFIQRMYSGEVEAFNEVLHPPPVKAKGPNFHYIPGDEIAMAKCAGFIDGWPVPLHKGDCELHQTNKQWLSKDVDLQKVRVVHAVKTMNQYLKTRVPAIQETWGKRLLEINPRNRVYFLTNEVPPKGHQLPLIYAYGLHQRKGLFQRVLNGLEILYNKHGNDTDWFNVVDDDTYLHPKLLLRYLAHFDPTKPYLLSQVSRQSEGKATCIPAANGGGGMILSKAAVKMLLDKTKCPRVLAFDDFEISHCLLGAGIKPTCVHDPDGKLRIMSRHPHDVLREGSGRFYRASVYPRFNSNPYGQDTLSKELISWNHAKSPEMYFYDFVFNHHDT